MKVVRIHGGKAVSSMDDTTDGEMTPICVLCCSFRSQQLTFVASDVTCVDGVKVAEFRPSLGARGEKREARGER